MSFRCFFPAWIVSWFTAVFAPSLVIAYLGLSKAAAAIGTGFHRLPASTWKVADDIGPVVKLMVGALLLICLLAFGRIAGVSRGMRPVATAAIGVAALAITVSLVPATFSRGFAIALTGNRFDTLITPIYLAGGALAGLMFALSFDRCSRRRRA